MPKKKKKNRVIRDYDANDVFWLIENDAMIYKLLNPECEFEEKKNEKKSKKNKKINKQQTK